MLKSANALEARMWPLEPLAKHSSFKIGGHALYYAQPAGYEDLYELLDFSETKNLPWLAVGNGSNILFSDDDYEGVVISLAGFEGVHCGAEGTRVRAGAGLGLTQLANWLAERGLGGMEFAGTIPGTVGGAVVMNAGYGRSRELYREMSDCLVEISVFDRRAGQRVLRKNDIAFGYRHTNLGNVIVTEAVFELEMIPAEEIRREMRANQEYRRQTQDLNYPSCGSVFKNPPGAYTAGKLIDMAGLRGFRIGDARISDKHGNFIVNLGRARARDVLELIALAQKKVKDEFRICLELEMKYVTSFQWAQG